MATKLNFYRRKLPDICIGFSSVKGKQIFKEALDAGYMDAFFSLGPQLRTQDEPAYCGLTSLVMVLNAFAVDPGKVWKGVWRWYHEDMLECCTSLNEVKQFGVSLHQLSCIAKCNQLEAELVYADNEANLDDLRNEIKKTCSTARTGIIASFGRKVLGQTGTGHFAPIGGYHPEEDLALVLEPARFKYPPFWIPVPLLWEAMQTIDADTGKPRGYLLLKKSDSHPTLLFHISRMLNAGTINLEFTDYLEMAISFLKRKVDPAETKEMVFQTAAVHLLQLSSHYKASKKSLFFTVLKKHEMENYSPEHQRAISLLVGAIERTEAYKSLKEESGSMVCCDHELFDHGVGIDCMAGSCVLCFPHYLTILMFILPIFSPTSTPPPVPWPPRLSISTEDYTGSYLETIVTVTQEVDWENMPHMEKEDPESDLMEGRQLLINEIEEVRKQVRSVLHSSNVCCGNQMS